MPLQEVTQFTQMRQLAGIKETLAGKVYIQRGRGMSLGEHQTVAVCP